MSVLLDSQKGSNKAATAERNELKKKLAKMRKPVIIAAAVLVLLLALSEWLPEWKAKAALEAAAVSTSNATVSPSTRPVSGAVHLTLSRTTWSDPVPVPKTHCIFWWPVAPTDQLEVEAHRPRGGTWISWSEWKLLRMNGGIKTGLGWVRFRGDRVAYEYRLPGQCS